MHLDMLPADRARLVETQLPVCLDHAPERPSGKLRCARLHPGPMPLARNWRAQQTARHRTACALPITVAKGRPADIMPPTA